MRVDYGIIMARGNSQRMGSPKGATLFAGEPLLRRSCAPFVKAEIEYTIVTTPSLYNLYSEIQSNCNWLLSAHGEGTAKTCKLVFMNLLESVTHFWLMPLDLPSVKQETIEEIHKASTSNPGKIIVPYYEGCRGHPVVMPAQCIVDFSSECWKLEMRDVIAKSSCEVYILKVDDIGIINDCDKQSDLEL